MAYTIVGIKELHRDLVKITKKAGRGESFLVMKYSKPVFKIEPAETASTKKYQLEDLLNLRFQPKTKDKNISKNIDKIVYGI